MKLHESPSPNARRVHVFMADKGIEMERVTVDIRAGENITPEFIAKNPGAVFQCSNWTMAPSSANPLPSAATLKHRRANLICRRRRLTERPG